MACRCTTVGELYGREAEEYVSDHLLRGATRMEQLEEHFTCPDTGRA